MTHGGVGRNCIVTAGVRKNSLMVLTHLIMNDMMKVKGHIARMALCLQDPQPRIKDLAHLFFHELAQKNYKVSCCCICMPFKQAFVLAYASQAQRCKADLNLPKTSLDRPSGHLHDAYS